VLIEVEVVFVSIIGVLRGSIFGLSARDIGHSANLYIQIVENTQVDRPCRMCEVKIHKPGVVDDQCRCSQCICASMPLCLTGVFLAFLLLFLVSAAGGKEETSKLYLLFVGDDRIHCSMNMKATMEASVKVNVGRLEVYLQVKRNGTI
jgi:hypothetical protein